MQKVSKIFSVSNSHLLIDFRCRILSSRSCFLLLLVLPLIKAIIFLSTSSKKQRSECSKSIKIYYYTVLSEISKQIIKLNPPARKVVIAVKPDDVAISCSCDLKVYTCVSGKTLKIVTEVDNLIQEFLFISLLLFMNMTNI